MEHTRVTDQASLAWEQVRGEVGFAVHESFKTRQTLNGFADHPWNPYERRPRVCETCDDQGEVLLPRAKHHDHQVAWDKLTPAARESYTRQGEIPWKMGYLSAQADLTGLAAIAGFNDVAAYRRSMFGDATMTTDVMDHPFRPQPSGPGLPRVEEPTPVCWQHDPQTGGICGRPEDEHALEGMVGG